MPVYFIAQVEVHDQAGYDAYASGAGATLGATECKVLAADDAPSLIEGEWHGPRTVIVEFESEEALRKWYDSPEYQEVAKLRWDAARSNSVIVHGIG